MPDPSPEGKAAPAAGLPRPSTKRGEATRRKLLIAAEREFGAQGYHAASVASITKRAGVGQGTFYLYFPGKDDAMRELVRHMGRELRRALASATAGARDRLETERRGFEAFVRFALEHRDLYRVVMESQFVDEEVYRAYYRDLADGYARGLRRAADAGEIRPGDAEARAWALMGIAHFLGLRYALWEDGPDADRVLGDALDASFDLIRRGLEPPAENATGSAAAEGGRA